MSTCLSTIEALLQQTTKHLARKIPAQTWPAVECCSSSAVDLRFCWSVPRSGAGSGCSLLLFCQKATKERTEEKTARLLHPSQVAYICGLICKHATLIMLSPWIHKNGLRAHKSSSFPSLSVIRHLIRLMTVMSHRGQLLLSSCLSFSILCKGYRPRWRSDIWRTDRGVAEVRSPGIRPATEDDIRHNAPGLVEETHLKTVVFRFWVTQEIAKLDKPSRLRRRRTRWVLASRATACGSPFLHMKKNYAAPKTDFCRVKRWKSWTSMCTSRIVFVCRVGERPRQDIETPSRFGRSVADTVVEARACRELHLKKRQRRPTLREVENAAGYHYLCFRFSLASSTFRLWGRYNLVKKGHFWLPRLYVQITLQPFTFVNRKYHIFWKLRDQRTQKIKFQLVLVK